MKKLILLFYCFALNVFAYETGTFDKYNIKPGNEDTSLAIIDTSPFSLQWLEKNKQYLISKKIPILGIGFKQSEVNLINSNNKGLVLGIVPEPTDMLDVLLNQLGVKYYPGVIENGAMWQINPNEVSQ